MNRRIRLPVVLILALLAAAFTRQSPADEPKKADDTPKAVEQGTLVVIDSAGKELKLKTWKFTTGIRHLSWLAPAAPAKAPADKEKGARPAPKAKLAGPEALVMREDNGTLFADGVQTLVPLDRIRAIDFNAEKETMTVRVATSAKAEDDVTLTGPTGYKDINALSIDAEVDKGNLGVAEVHFSGGGAKGIRGVRFPLPKFPAEVKDGRLASITYAERKGKKHVANVTDLHALYRTEEGETLATTLFFKQTIKIDLAKIKKIAPNKEDSTKTAPIWQITLKSGDDESLTLLLRVELEGKPAQLEGFLCRVPSGYKQFPVDNAELLQEVEFDVKKDEGRTEEAGRGQVRPRSDDGIACTAQRRVTPW